MKLLCLLLFSLSFTIFISLQSQDSVGDKMKQGWESSIQYLKDKFQQISDWFKEKLSTGMQKVSELEKSAVKLENQPPSETSAPTPASPATASSAQPEQPLTAATGS